MLRVREKEAVMSRRHAFIVAAAAVLVVASGARAADYPPPLPPIVQKAPMVVEEFVSGWYLRGDLGYRLNSVGAATPNFGAVPTGSTIDNSFGSAAVAATNRAGSAPT